MRLSKSATVSLAKGHKRRKLSSLQTQRLRARKKHKRLDAICEKAFNRNRVVESDLNTGNVGEASGNVDSELRRSCRVRRAPMLLDASPSPVKKRLRIDKNRASSSKTNEGFVDRGKGRDCSENQSSCSDSDDLEELGSWRSRLRSRVRNVSFKLKENDVSPRGKRRLFKESDGFREEPKLRSEELDDRKEVFGGSRSRLRSRVTNVSYELNENGVSPRGKRRLFKDSDGFREEPKLRNEELDDRKEGLEGLNSPVAKSKTPGLAKGFIGSKSGDQAIGSSSSKEDGNERNVGERLLHLDEEDVVLEKSAMSDGSERVVADGCLTHVVEKEERKITTCSQLEECSGSKDLETTNQNNEQLEQPDCDKGGGNQVDAIEVVRLPASELDDGGCCPGVGVCSDKLDKKPLEDVNAKKLDTLNCFSKDRVGKPRIREGRRCGLCGGGADGKPPKRLIQDSSESDNEAYGSSSSSEEPSYDIWDGFGDEPCWLGRLLGPMHDRFGIAGVWVHQHCAVWSPEVWFIVLAAFLIEIHTYGFLEGTVDVYFAGLGCLKNVRAALCRGRALKCSRCGRPRATIGCRVDRCPKTYHLPCARADGCIFDHRKFLIACTDHRHLFQPQGNQYFDRLKKMKARKMKLEMRKLSNDAWKKDFEAEEKWLENCGEDEEFLKREGKRLHRDMLRIAPVYIGGSSSESEKLFQGWESVAGLQDVIRCMKEVVILPLLYPEFFSTVGLEPPRGVLLHGYPGTGKTLVVRALIGSISRGDKRIAYFARKGADLLGKYVGDAERQLRLLFQVAERSQPSVIFFDEIDGLAPCRTSLQDQTQSSVVSTLLALLDGLKSRGSVIVIGATNRPEAVDPALRRPGRFDREIYFPLPSVQDRAAILSLHTQRWLKPVAGSLLKWIARQTAGFAGADLQALCTQAVMIALKRNFPLQEFLSAAEKKAIEGRRFSLPSFAVEERDLLEALACAPPPCSRREAGMAANEIVSSPLQTHLIPCLLQPLSLLLVSLYLYEGLWLPPILSKAAKVIKSVIISALEKKKMPSRFWGSHVNDLIQEADVAREIERNLSHVGIVNGAFSFAGSDALKDDTDDDNENSEPCKVHHAGARTSLLRNLSYSSRKTSRFRVLIAGSPRSGQRHLASCLLHGFVGNIEIQKVNLATISQEGRGDVVQGVTHILLKCASLGSCIVYMPRIDLWALETCRQVAEKENDSCLTDHQVAENENDSFSKACKSEEREEPQDLVENASQAWNSFVEQVDSMCMSASLMILVAFQPFLIEQIPATSEVPNQVLPLRIRQFFTGDVLNCNVSDPSEHTIPRFVVQVDGNFNHDMVINSSAAELSQNLVQQYVQLIHHSNHIGETCKEYKFNDTSEANTEMECHNPEYGAADEGNNLPVISGKRASKDDVYCNGNQIQKRLNANERGPPTLETNGHQDDEVRLRRSEYTGPRVPPHIRTVKGKSSLLLAISTFGYQILRYPHFSELCWATSKLREGPFTDINGPWKGWPFNSCIVRPNNSLEKLSVGWSSSNLKNRENFGLVRGLIAVGLLAYRGVYSSLREVSFEVRKVLELLIGQVNAKIQGGKERDRFVRLLSLVAYMEDMVNSWAYSLQSLELDGQMPVANHSPTTGSDACKTNVSNKSSHEEVGGENPQGFLTKNVECIDLNKRVGHIALPDSGTRVLISKEGPSQQMVFLGPSAPGACPISSSVADQLASENTLNEQYHHSETCRSETPVTHELVCGDFESLKQTNGFARAESVIPSEDDICSIGESGVIFVSGSTKVSNQSNGLLTVETSLLSEGMHNPDEPTGDINFTSKKSSSLSADSGVVCLYGCCSECLHTIHVLIQKILVHEWELNGSCWTVGDVHDVVASWSVNLLSAVRKIDAAENASNSKFFDKTMRHGFHGKMPECQDAGNIQVEKTSCQCKSEGNKVFLPMECSCHSVSKSSATETNSCTDSQAGLDLKLIFRDGVLIPAGPDKDPLMARSNKYASINFNDIYENKKKKPSSSSSSASSSSTDPQKSHLPTTRTHGGMLVLTRPSPKPQPPPQPKPDPDPTLSEPNPVSLRSSSSSSPSTTIVSQERDRESPPSIPFSKPEAFVPPHLRPGFVGREERFGLDGQRQSGFRAREIGAGIGQHGSPSRYGEEGRPKSGGYERR
ncbi:hypothetical protein HHK36_023595 [Tetracentron sinense]|uniref:PHD-type domain-containing protein n=1 Tax=Tetracentron sinense TaxID=13715 RepID=A0A835D5D2_TETSI|nr:hypothetical protein HHK36_023595 [Tetracentron sinense]